MNKLIEQIFNGEVILADYHKHAFNKNRKKFRKKADIFMGKLDEKLQEEFILLTNDFSINFPVDMEEEFSQGFKLGVRIMFEAFSDSYEENL